jgi:hypothetical protein
MLRFTRLPKQVANWLQVLRPMFRHRHHLVFCWFIVCQAVYQLIQRRGYFYVMAFARTWCFDNGHSLKDLVTHLPKHRYRRCWVPLEEPCRHRTYWTFTKPVCLQHIGDVTIILSKKRRNDGPNATKILVTNLPDVTARQVVDVYRWR